MRRTSPLVPHLSPSPHALLTSHSAPRNPLQDASFQVQLCEQRTDEPTHKVLLGGQAQFGSCMVQIRDDDKTPGQFCWDKERIEVLESCGSVNLTVLRTMGLSGEVSIKRS